MKNHKNEEEGKLGRPWLFTAAKSTFATAHAFAAANGCFTMTKGCFTTAKQNYQNGHPRDCCSEVVLRHGKGTVHTSKNFYFVSKTSVFVHR